MAVNEYEKAFCAEMREIKANARKRRERKSSGPIVSAKVLKHYILEANERRERNGKL